MATEIDICNSALSFLGQEATITSIEQPEGSEQADQCARFYPVSRDYLLESHAWCFATKRVALAVQDTDKLGWRFTYSQPSDSVRILCISDENDRYFANPADFQCETDANGRKIILSDQEFAVARYIWKNKRTNDYSEAFCQALSYLLAYRLAGSMIKGTTGAKMSEEMFKNYQMALSNARQLDAQQNRETSVMIPRWMTEGGKRTRGAY